MTSTFKVHIGYEKFRSEGAKKVSDDISDGDETNNCTDTESSDCDVFSSDSGSKSEESSDASAHEAVFVPLNNPNKQRKSVVINIFHQSHAHVNARLLTKIASQFGVKLTGRLH